MLHAELQTRLLLRLMGLLGMFCRLAGMLKPQHTSSGKRLDHGKLCNVGGAYPLQMHS